MLTSQEIFDKVTTHLLTQNCRAAFQPERISSPCQYVSANGNRCAIGALLTKSDPEALKQINVPVTSPRLESILRENGLDTTEPALEHLGRLQHVHDNFYPEDWPLQLRLVAVRYRLSSAVVDNFVRLEET